MAFFVRPSVFQVYGDAVYNSATNVAQGGAGHNLFAHQRQALIQTKAYFDNPQNTEGLIVIPTGGGKSGIAVLLAYSLKPHRVLVLTPSKIITKQLELDFKGSQHRAPFLLQRGIVPAANIGDVATGMNLHAAIKQADLFQMQNCEILIVNAHKFGDNDDRVVNIDSIPHDQFDLVIVDEAHHYPAPTWERVVHHFGNAKKLFLTATPFNRGEEILPGRLAYQITVDNLVQAGVIRASLFDELGAATDAELVRNQTTARRIRETLRDHDQAQPQFPHKALVLTYQRFEAETFALVANRIYGNGFAGYYHGSSGEEPLVAFLNGDIRVLAVCGKLLEGFDHSEISVCAILRNVAPKSKVLFAQFVGRCLRKTHQQDDLVAVVMSHAKYKQGRNYDQLNELAEDDPEDDE